MASKYLEAQKRNRVKKELAIWQAKVQRATYESSTSELYKMWSCVRGLRRNKPKKGYWYSKEASETIARVLDQIGNAARKKEDKSPVDIEEAVRTFTGGLHG